MRFFIALLAVIGLLTSPAVAAAAQAACHSHGGEKMMHMATADMPSMAQPDSHKAARCCDPAKDPGKSKHKAADCAQACAAMCGVLAALPSSPMTLVAPPSAAPPLARTASLKPYEPSRLKRPPRSIA